MSGCAAETAARGDLSQIECQLKPYFSAGTGYVRAACIRESISGAFAAIEEPANVC